MGVEMEKVKIGILWNDGEYAEALARALASGEHSFLPVIADHRQDFLMDAQAEGILLTNDLTIEDNRAILLRHPVLPGTAARMIREKYELLFEKRIPNGRADRQKRNCGITVITGAVGGVGASALADGLAEEFAVYYDKNVLRLSFSAFPEGRSAGRDREQKELKRLFFSFFSSSSTADPEKRKADFGKSLEPEDYFEQDEAGVWHAEYGNGVNPLAEAEEKELQCLFQALESTGRFDLLILDIPAERLMHISDLLFSAENILVVKKTASDSVRDYKMLNYLYFLLGEEETEKLVFVNNAVCALEENMDDEDTEKEKKENVRGERQADVSKSTANIKSVFVSYDPEAFRDGRVKIDGSFGLAVKEVAHILSFC